MHLLRVCVCVCVLASGYGWGTVMHEIPISSFHILMTSLPYPRTQQYYSSSAPPRGGCSHEKVPTSPSYLGYRTPWQLLVGSSTTQAPTLSIIAGVGEGRQTSVCPSSSTWDSDEERGNDKLVSWAISDRSRTPGSRVRGRAGNQYLVRMGETHKPYLLELQKMGTYVTYLYIGFHEYRAQVKSLILRIDTCKWTHTNSYVINQSYEFMFTTWYPLVSPHIRLQIRWVQVL